MIKQQQAGMDQIPIEPAANLVGVSNHPSVYVGRGDRFLAVRGREMLLQLLAIPRLKRCCVDLLCDVLRFDIRIAKGTLQSGMSSHKLGRDPLAPELSESFNQRQPFQALQIENAGTQANVGILIRQRVAGNCPGLNKKPVSSERIVVKHILKSW